MNRPQSPDSINLADYEAYLRRVLPNLVRNALEVAVSNELEPIETQLQGRMMEIIQAAQNRAFSSFRDMRRSESGARSPAGLDTNIASLLTIISEPVLRHSSSLRLQFSLCLSRTYLNSGFRSKVQDTMMHLTRAMRHILRYQIRPTMLRWTGQRAMRCFCLASMAKRKRIGIYRWMLSPLMKHNT